MKITKAKLKQIIKEELGRVLDENVPNPEFRAKAAAGNEYYIEDGEYGLRFFGPDGPMKPDPVDPGDPGAPLSLKNIVAATAHLPGFEKYMDRGPSGPDQSAGKADVFITHPYYRKTGHKNWDGLFQFYLQKTLNPKAQVVATPQAPQEDPDY